MSLCVLTNGRPSRVCLNTDLKKQTNKQTKTKTKPSLCLPPRVHKGLHFLCVQTTSQVSLIWNCIVFFSPRRFLTFFDHHLLKIIALSREPVLLAYNETKDKVMASANHLHACSDWTYLICLAPTGICF